MRQLRKGLPVAGRRPTLSEALARAELSEQALINFIALAPFSGARRVRPVPARIPVQRTPHHAEIQLAAAVQKLRTREARAAVWQARDTTRDSRGGRA